MKIMYNGENFYNYAKKQNITVQLNKCPVCHNEATLVVENETQEECVKIGHGFAACSNSKCFCRTRDFYTDTNHCLDLGIEQAQKEWNSKDFDYLEYMQNM